MPFWAHNSWPTTFFVNIVDKLYLVSMATDKDRHFNFMTHTLLRVSWAVDITPSRHISSICIQIVFNYVCIYNRVPTCQLWWGNKVCYSVRYWLHTLHTLQINNINHKSFAIRTIWTHILITLLFVSTHFNHWYILLSPMKSAHMSHWVIDMHVYYILWPDLMWYTGIWSPHEDQSGQWRSISMTSQWSLIMTSQWVLMLLGMCIVKSQWVMMLLGTSIVTSQWVMTLLCIHIMASQCIMTLLWTFSIMYFLLYP